MSNTVHWSKRGSPYTDDGRIRPELFTPPRLAFLRQIEKQPAARPSMNRDVVRFALRMRLATWDTTGRNLGLTDAGRTSLATYGTHHAA